TRFSRDWSSDVCSSDLVNPPLDRKTLISRGHDPALQKHRAVVKGSEESLVRLGDQFWNFYPPVVLESVNWIPNTRVFSWFNRVRSEERRVGNACRSLWA